MGLMKCRCFQNDLKRADASLSLQWVDKDQDEGDCKWNMKALQANLLSLNTLQLSLTLFCCFLNIDQENIPKNWLGSD